MYRLLKTIDKKNLHVFTTQAWSFSMCVICCGKFEWIM